MKRLLVFLGLLLLLAPARADEVSVGIYRVRVEVNPTPAQVGSNHLTVTVQRPIYNDKGQIVRRPSEGLQVSVQPAMPSMPAMKNAAVELEETRAGVYEGQLSCSMAGDWALRISLSGPDGAGSMTYALTVTQAAPPGQQPSPSPPASSMPGLPNITASLEPPAQVGDNQVRIQVADTQGRVIPGIIVSAALCMPGMSMVVAPRVAQAGANGTYTLATRLQMPGLWNLTVDVDHADVRLKRQVFPLTVRPLPPSWSERWPTLAMGVAVALVGSLGGLGLIGSPPTFSLRNLVGCLLCLGLPLGAGELIHEHWPPDSSMGMPMDMNAPDMGLSMADMAAPMPVEIETLVRRPLYATLSTYGLVEPRGVAAEVPASEVARLRVGAVTYLTAPGEGPVKTRVARIGGSVDPRSQTVQVEVDFPNRALPPRGLRPGLRVALRMVTDGNDSALPVPLSALFDAYGQASVWKVEEVAAQLIIRRRGVHLGQAVGSLVDVMGGLQAGDRVVTTRIEPLQEGMPVTPARLGAGPYRNLLLPSGP